MVLMRVKHLSSPATSVSGNTHKGARREPLGRPLGGTSCDPELVMGGGVCKVEAWKTTSRALSTDPHVRIVLRLHNRTPTVSASSRRSPRTRASTTSPSARLTACLRRSHADDKSTAER